MKVKRYIASTSRDALRQVKEELGADAVISSNKKTRDGVEIMALADAEMSGLAQSSSPATKARSETSHAPKVADSYAKALPVANEPTEAKKTANEAMSVALAHDIIAEIQAMKSTLEDQLATVAWGNFTQRRQIGRAHV